LEILVLDAARDFFNNAESGDKTKGYMKIALNWYYKIFNNSSLSVYPKTTYEIKKERDLIDAVHLMTCSHYNLDMLPIQVRLEPDKLIFIKRLLERHSEIINDLGYMYGLAEKLIGHSLRTQEKIIILALAATAAISVNPNIAYKMCEKGSDLALKIHTSDLKPVQGLLASFFLFLNDETIHNVAQKQNLVTLALSWCPQQDIAALVTIYEQLELKSLSPNFQILNDKKSTIEESLKLVNTSLNHKDIHPPKFIESEQLMDCFLDEDQHISDHHEYNLLWQVLGLNGGIERLDNMYWDEAIIELAKLVNSRNPALSICFLFHLKNVKIYSLLTSSLKIRNFSLIRFPRLLLMNSWQRTFSRFF
jgi:hypothetical protein